MKKLIKINSIRHVTRILCALCIAFIINYYLAGEKQGWLLPLSTVIVMLTATGSAVYQGLWRFLFLSSIVTIASLIFSPAHLLYIRMYDVVLGALIGLFANTTILPDRVDSECRNAFIPILKSYSAYFSALVILLLDKNTMAAEKKKINVEKQLQKLPAWVYEVGFDLTLQKGYRYFFMQVGHIGEILFSMHHVARYSFPVELLHSIREPLIKCIARVEQLMNGLTARLALEKLSEEIFDFAVELAEIEEKCNMVVPTTLKAHEMSADYIYLMEFIYDLQELRRALLRLTEALR